jgi:UDP-glucuronate 4-epimerase
MQLQKNLMNLWHILTVIFLNYQQLDSDFLLFMDPGVDQIWLYLNLLIQLLNDEPIDVFNHGKHTRDFTYIDDIVEGIIKVLDNPAESNKNWNSSKPDPANSKAPWRIYNIGNNQPVKLMDYIYALENALKKKAKINFLPLQPGDVQDTYANIDNLLKKFNYKPKTSVTDGINNFVKWYRNYYNV